MYEHLQHFLEKMAAAVTPDVSVDSGSTGDVPSFPPASATNMGKGPAPPLASTNRFEPAIAGASAKSTGGGSSFSSKAAPASGMNKLQSVRSVDDFTAKVRGPLADTRKEQYTSPFDEKPVEWGAPASVEGGDAGTRWAPAGTTHPDVKVAQRTRAALTALRGLGSRVSKGWGALSKSRLGKGLSMTSEAGETTVGAADTAGDIMGQLGRRLSSEDLASRAAQGRYAGTPNPLGGAARQAEARRMSRFRGR